MFTKLRLWDFNNLRTTINNVNQIRNYAFKSDLKIKWVRPEKIPCFKPEKSGDLAPNAAVDKSSLQFEFQGSKELETANDLVKRLFTLEFAPRSKVREIEIRNNEELVKKHALDRASIETKIARWTGCIRSLQETMEEHPRNVKCKVRLKELIDKRKKHLKYLRRWDYKKFEWLLEQLNIVYKPEAPWHRVTRKDSLRKLTDIHCEELRNQKLTEYRLALEAEQPAFLEEKIKTLEIIRQHQQECNVPITVSQKDIDDVKLQLETLLKERNNQKQVA